MKLAKVRFSVDFRGKLTNERYYLAGNVEEFDLGIASQLVAEGRAVFVEEEQEQSEPEPATEVTEVKAKRGRKPKGV